MMLLYHKRLLHHLWFVPWQPNLATMFSVPLSIRSTMAARDCCEPLTKIYVNIPNMKGLNPDIAK